jgi:Fic family protein
MSTKELSRLEVIQRLSKKQMSQKEAGEIPHLSTRQVKRLLQHYVKHGAADLDSKHRRQKAITAYQKRSRKKCWIC